MDTGPRKSEDNITKGLKEPHKRRDGPHAIGSTDTDLLRFGRRHHLNRALLGRANQYHQHPGQS
jgi:hypothetical protein